jgi:hypothetical protein
VLQAVDAHAPVGQRRQGVVVALFVKDVVTLKSFNFDYGIAPLIAAALSP